MKKDELTYDDGDRLGGCSFTLLKIAVMLLIGAWFFAACMTTNRIEKNCDKFELICVTETTTEKETTTETTTETTYGDTTVIVYIPEKKVRDKIPVRIEDEKKKPIPVKKKFVNSALSVLTVPFAKSYAQVVNSRLEHELIQIDTLLLIEMKNALKDRKTLEAKIISLKQVKIVPIKENTRLAVFAIKWLWFSFSIIIILILSVIFKNRLSGLFKRL